ncbi:FHA domain protein [Actinomyces graevenitzii F0530]|uniref:FHA domain protein n=2 Tax=Actinomyces graevenitzii TaxID=55565 RepID=U1Q153_9ACTO|nr:RDD family protein [Actinomyces graevenitzii]ERH16316.1 FHA domain protein [Actinomyces graevenitzii F0530]
MSLNSRPAPVPAHLQGTRLAALWPRVFARLIDSLIFSLVIGGGSGAVMFFGAGNQSNRTPFWISLGVSIAVTVLLCIGYLVALMRSGQTPGLRMLGLAWAGFKNSGPPRGAAFNKLALQLGVSLVTAGIGNLVIYALSRDHLNRFWFDRASGVIVLNVRQGVNPVRLQSNPLTLPNQPFAPQTGAGAGDMDEFGLHPQLPGVQAAAHLAQNSFATQAPGPNGAFNPGAGAAGYANGAPGASLPGAPGAGVPGGAGPANGAPGAVSSASAPAASSANFAGANQSSGFGTNQANQPPQPQLTSPGPEGGQRDSDGVITSLDWNLQAPAQTAPGTSAPSSTQTLGNSYDETIVPSANTEVGMDPVLSSNFQAPAQTAPAASAPSSGQLRVPNKPFSGPIPVVVPDELMGEATAAQETGQVDISGTDWDEHVTIAKTSVGKCLRLDTGDVINVTSAVVLGRNPVPAGMWAQADVVPVADPNFSISKTHLAVRVDGQYMFVTDLGSTNGTSVVAPDGSRTHVLAGAMVPVTKGYSIVFGDRRLEVE